MVSTPRFDRDNMDVGNIVFLDHINLCIPDQIAATIFYIEGLGLTRDPYYMVGIDNMWVNVGQQQLHLVTGPPQHFRGYIGLVIPSTDALKRRLDRIEPRLKDTAFAWHDAKDGVTVTCPWGNVFRIFQQYERFAKALGIPFIHVDVPLGSAEKIFSFYTDILQARALIKDNTDSGKCTEIYAGPAQKIIFCETDQPIEDFDGHHICIYTPNFAEPYHKLESAGLVTTEDNKYQYRFEEIKPPGEKSAVYALQHEVRSLYHPHYLRPLVNRKGTERLP